MTTSLLGANASDATYKDSSRASDAVVIRCCFDVIFILVMRLFYLFHVVLCAV